MITPSTFRLLAFASLFAASAVAQEFPVEWKFADFTLRAPSVRQVHITPLWIENDGQQIVHGDRNTYATGRIYGTNNLSYAGTTGTLIVSNMVPGGYRIEFAGNTTVTTFTNWFPTNLVSGVLVNAKDYRTNILFISGANTGYSQAAANARFVLKNDGVATNLGVDELTAYTGITLGGVRLDEWPTGSTGQPDWFLWASNGTYWARNRLASSILVSNDFSALMSFCVTATSQADTYGQHSVELAAGTFIVSNTIVITNYAIIRGYGNPSTILRAADGFNATMFEVGRSDFFNDGITRFENIRFELVPGTTNAGGIDFLNSAEANVRFCEFNYIKRFGIRIGNTLGVNHWSQIESCWFVQTNFGVNAGSDYPRTASILLDHGHSASDGIIEVQIHNNLFSNGGGIAVHNKNYRNTSIVGNRFLSTSAGTPRAIQVDEGDNINISHNIFRDWRTASGSLTPVLLSARAAATNVNLTAIGNVNNYSRAFPQLTTNLFEIGSNNHGLFFVGHNPDGTVAHPIDPTVHSVIDFNIVAGQVFASEGLTTDGTESSDLLVEHPLARSFLGGTNTGQITFGSQKSLWPELTYSDAGGWAFYGTDDLSGLGSLTLLGSFTGYGDLIAGRELFIGGTTGLHFGQDGNDWVVTNRTGGDIAIHGTLATTGGFVGDGSGITGVIVDDESITPGQFDESVDDHIRSVVTNSFDGPENFMASLAGLGTGASTNAAHLRNYSYTNLTDVPETFEGGGAPGTSGTLNGYMAVMVKDVAQTISDEASTTVITNYQQASSHEIGTNTATGTITVTNAGNYFINASVWGTFANQTDTPIVLHVFKDGESLLSVSRPDPETTNIVAIGTGSRLVTLEAGDELDLRIYAAYVTNVIRFARLEIAEVPGSYPVATNITYPLLSSFVGPTNSIALDNSAVLYIADSSVEITNITATAAGQWRAASLSVSNSTASAITLSVAIPSARRIGSGSTNLLTIPAAKIGKATIESLGVGAITYSTGVEQ